MNPYPMTSRSGSTDQEGRSAARDPFTSCPFDDRDRRPDTRRRHGGAGVDGWRGPRQLVVQRGTKSLTRPRQTGHDGSNRYLKHVSQLSIGQVLEFTKHEQFTKSVRQAAQRPFDQGDVVGAQQQRFWTVHGTIAAVLLFIERVGQRLRGPL